MKSNFAFFLGLLGALAISWAGIVLGSNAQLGALAPFYDDSEATAFPQWMPGAAAQGQLVYRDLGCAACHTQQVRRPGFGSDTARGWGDRQSVARDYIYQPYPQLGRSRVGPDLANLADRKPSAMDASDLMHLLYAGDPGMPSYRFLFEMRRLGVGAQPSDKALKLVGDLEPKEGWEVIPTARADSLVAYLLSLKNPYAYPEAVPVPPEKPEGEADAAKAAPAAAAPAPQPAGAAATPPAAAPQGAAAGSTVAPAAGSPQAAPSAQPAAATAIPAAATPAATPAGATAAPAAGSPQAAPAVQPAAASPAVPAPTPADGQTGGAK